MHFNITIIAIASALGVSSTAFVGPPNEEHFDIWLQPMNGRIVTGSITEGMPGRPIKSVERVFGAELGDDPAFPFSASEPGMQAVAGPLTAGMTWSFNIVAALGAWNGGGFDDADEIMRIDFGPASASTASGFVPGFGFTGFADGLMHDHFDFTLEASSPLAGADPEAGIYLLSLEFLGVNGPNQYAASDPTFLVFNLGKSEEEHEAAIAWAQSNLVPAPATASMLLLAMCGATRRRRRDPASRP